MFPHCIILLFTCALWRHSSSTTDDLADSDNPRKGVPRQVHLRLVRRVHRPSLSLSLSLFLSYIQNIIFLVLVVQVRVELTPRQCDVAPGGGAVVRRVHGPPGRRSAQLPGRASPSTSSSASASVCTSSSPLETYVLRQRRTRRSATRARSRSRRVRCANGSRTCTRARSSGSPSRSPSPPPR